MEVYILDKLTPMMKQYMTIKNEYTDSILFFRLGDFYEMFFDDAIVASKELEIALTSRGAGMGDKVPMCGIPHHVAENYIARLVEKGYKVAVCDQVEDPALAQGIVKRDVVRVVTPGTITDSSALDAKSNNFLVSIYMDNYGVGISYVDNSTGEMFTSEYLGSIEDAYVFVLDELGKTYPSEIICNKAFTNNNKYMKIIKNRINPFINVYEDIINMENMDSNILKLFGGKTQDELGIKDKLYSILSTNKLIEYLYSTQKNSLDHINRLNYYRPQNFMVMDINTRANLEIHETIMSRDKKGALINVLDKTSTAMGGRLLKKWLEQPLISVANINQRLNVVEYFTSNLMVLDEVRDLLKKVYDIERISSKVTSGNCNGRDFISLKNSLSILPELKEILIKTNCSELMGISENIDSLADIFTIIDKAIEESPPIGVKDGGLIKRNYRPELDHIRDTSLKGKEWLADLESKERENTGIKNLKIGYNRIAGYYFEVTKANIDSVPDYFIRRQTLVNAERYYTDELKSMESQILGADERALEMEYMIFQEIRDIIKAEIVRLQDTSKYVSIVDLLNTFAYVAYKNNFIRPKTNTKGYIHIEEGRHPVVEKNIENNLFVPNDTVLDTKKNMVQIITGPNMAGKSTYMRQVAIITLLCQIGSFVPAKSADISIVDRIFTRIGASDNLSQGESTFMVEMNEVSNIIKYASKDSLIILDEVGRGTSTFDGLSIAWAVAEYIAEVIKAKTLFATHYHELTQLENSIKGIVNLTIVAEEKGDDIVFLRKVVKGSTNKSYGIQVSRLAGLNKDIINRANEILLIIEGSHQININDTKVEPLKQLNLLDYKKDYYLDRVRKIDIGTLTPIEALNTLNNLVEDAKNLKGNS